MNPKKSNSDILDQLSVGVIVALTEKQWLKAAGRFSIVETIETGMSGQIQLLRPSAGEGKKRGWAFVEQPKDGHRVVRPFKNEKEARALIKDRLAAYERMWDG